MTADITVDQKSHLQNVDCIVLMRLEFEVYFLNCKVTSERQKNMKEPKLNEFTY